MAIATRPITEEEVLHFRERINVGFGEDLDEQDRDPERFLAMFPLERTVAAFDGDEIVGTLGAFALEVTVPGGASVPMAGTTIVTVAATHRRQGVLTAMIRDHLEDTAARDEALAGLWTAEAPIYGRFGFGQATSRDRVEAPQGALSIPAMADGIVRFIASAEVAGAFAPVFDEVRATKPGMLARSKDWWKHEVVHDPSHHRNDTSAKRFITFEADGRVEGYAIYTQKPDWNDFIPNGQVRVKEILATTDRAHTGLWNFVSNIDLYPRVRHWNLATDDPLWWKLVDPRRVERRRTDALWVRIMDVPAALEARTYESDGCIRIGVEDPFRPATSGVYELAVSDGVGKCVAVDEDPEVTFGIDVLGALYLGGSNALSMGAAGLIDGAHDRISELHRLFGTDAAPWCDDVF